MPAEWQFLVTLNERLRPLRDPVEVQQVAVRLIGEHLRANRVSYVCIEGDEFVVTWSYANGVPPATGRGALSRLGTSIVEAFRRGETIAVNDVRTDPRVADAERELFLAGHASAFVAVPVFKEGRWIATFGVDSTTPRVWTRDQVALIEETAERTWVSGERARAEGALRKTEHRQAFLRRLNDTIRPLGDPAQILNETCRLLGTHLHVDRVGYGEIEGDECVIVAEYVNGLPPQPHRFRWSGLGASRTTEILKGRTLSVRDTSTEPHSKEERAALQAAGIGAYICPLLVKDGRFIGSFGIHSRLPRAWTPDEIALAEEVADRVWTALEHRKAEAELRAKEERLAFLLRLNDAVRPLSDPKAVQKTAARLLGEHLGVSRVGYAELEGHEYMVYREHTRGAEPLRSANEINIGTELNDALQRGETVVVDDVHADARLSDDERATLLARQIAAFIGVALFKDGRIVAAFGANNNTPRAWTAAEVDLVRDVAERTWDAVERTRAERAIREQKQRLRLALEASAGGSWTWIPATDHVDWDDRFRALYGFSPDQPASTDAWMPLVHEDDRAHVFASLNELLTSKTKDCWENTFRIVRPDGSVAWIQSRGRVERDRDGNVVRMTGLDLDFNERRRAEEALQLRRDEEHDRALRMLLETATQGIVSVDDAGVIVSANRAFESIFGYAAAELIGQSLDPLMPSALRLRHARQGGVDLVGTRKDGSTFPIEVSVNHVVTPGGGRTFAFVTDITERQRAATALQERTAELERRTSQLRQMASDLTLAEQHAREQIAGTLHDGLQQLLVIASLNLEQLVKRDRETGIAENELLTEAKHHLDQAIGAARSLSLDLFPPMLQRSGLPAALEWLANWTRDKYKIEVQIVVDPQADSDRKDVRTLLFESVRELLFNAVKHARTDRITLELALDADDQLYITVTDRGIGFDAAKLDGGSQSGHVGWGLFSMRERLTQLGGRFYIDSTPGRGTILRLVAPRGAMQAGAETTAPPLVSVGLAQMRDDGHARPDALKILIVDDHAGVRTAMREILGERPQLSVVGDASNGYEAIACAHTLRPDVILMDVAMPYMDGVEATARIRAELPDITILGLSMQTRHETMDAIEHAGAAAFFVKGTDTQRLIDHLLSFHARRANGTRADV